MSVRFAPILAILALAACGGGGDEAGGRQAGSSGAEGAGKGDGFPRDTLVIGFQADAESMLDIVSQSASDSDIIGNLNYPLIDSGFKCEMVPTPGIATSWTRSEDGKTISLELRDDIKWSDGRTVSAEDIKFTMDLIANPAVASPRASYITRMVPGARPRIVDPTHIEFEFTECYDYITQLAHAAVVSVAPKHVLEDADPSTLRGHEFNTEPVINGRWKIGQWQRGERIVLEPNDAWSGPADEMPKLNRVIYRVLPEYATRLVELETGGIDLMESIQIADADRLAKEHPEIKLHRRGWRGMDYVGWNELDPEDYKAKKKAAEETYQARLKEIDAGAGTPEEKEAARLEAGKLLFVDLSTVKRHPIFGDKAVRRALGKAIDYDKIIADLLTSQVTGEIYGRRAVGTITPELCNAHAEGIKPLDTNVEEAKAELDALGWVDSDGDGIRDKDGVPMKFTLETNTGNPRRQKASVIIQANLKEIGVEVDIQQFESNTFFDRHRKRDFDASLSGWSAGLFVDPTVIWHSGDEYEFNYVSYENKQADELMEAILRECDKEKANAMLKELQQIIYDDQPYAFLFWRDEIVGLNDRFQDVTVDVQSPYGNLHQWWVPADKVKYQK